MYAFGDNSQGQIELNSIKFVYTKPYKIQKLNHICSNIQTIHAGSRISAIANDAIIDGSKPKITRKLYAWGNKDMIDCISQTSQTQGAKFILDHGTNGRGGSNNKVGAWTINHCEDDSQPVKLYVEYDNQVII